MTDPTTLEEALAAEFAGEILFVPTVPASLSPPQVIVIPGDPYLVPATHGAVEETWEVTSAVSIKETKVGFDQLRELNLRVGRACQKAGALWEQSDQPVITTSGQAQIVVSRNIIRFKYMP